MRGAIPEIGVGVRTKCLVQGVTYRCITKDYFETRQGIRTSELTRNR